jgi:hypothetical protein
MHPLALDSVTFRDADDLFYGSLVTHVCRSVSGVALSGTDKQLLRHTVFNVNSNACVDSFACSTVEIPISQRTEPLRNAGNTCNEHFVFAGQSESLCCSPRAVFQEPVVTSVASRAVRTYSNELIFTECQADLAFITRPKEYVVLHAPMHPVDSGFGAYRHIPYF